MLQMTIPASNPAWQLIEKLDEQRDQPRIDLMATARPLYFTTVDTQPMLCHALQGRRCQCGIRVGPCRLCCRPARLADIARASPCKLGCGPVQVGLVISQLLLNFVQQTSIAGLRILFRFFSALLDAVYNFFLSRQDFSL